MMDGAPARLTGCSLTKQDMSLMLPMNTNQTVSATNYMVRGNALILTATARLVRMIIRYPASWTVVIGKFAATPGSINVGAKGEIMDFNSVCLCMCVVRIPLQFN